MIGSKQDPLMVDAFLDRLKRVMHKRGMTQAELARRIGVKQSTVCYYYNRKKFPTLSICVKIADALDVSLDWLCGVKEKPDEADVYRLKRIAESVVEGTRDTYACLKALNVSARALVKWAEKYELDLNEEEQG